MTEAITKDRKRIEQGSFIERFKRPVRPAEMITAYYFEHVDSHYHATYCCMIPIEKIEKSLEDMGWEFSCGDGLPGAVIYHDKGHETVKYLRFGEDSGIEPLVICRDFYGMREGYKEISEEFRLFHRLYHDLKQDQYIKIDDAGNEEVVAIVEPGWVKIRLKEIRQFLAIKEMYLVQMFDYREHSLYSLAYLGISEGERSQVRDELFAYALGYGDLSGFDDSKAFSRLLAKRLFPPLPKEKSGFWGFAEEKEDRYEDFIIGQDDDGEDIYCTCDPGLLANYFGANPDMPHYLTPIHFKKEVLNKYYQQPQKYSVDDGYLACGSLWGLTMDNHHKDTVIVWLGDLGKSLSYEEQLHWKSFNLPPVGGISETFHKRQILAEFADSDRPEHVFKYRYQSLLDACKGRLGWQILLPLEKEDKHYLDAIRISSNDAQKDFDELVLGLTKVLVDSLNEKQLNGRIPKEDLAETKGSIARLEKFIVGLPVDGSEDHIKFLRDLQSLRSSGAAHRKGSNYKKIAKTFGVDDQNLRSVFEGILVKAIQYLEFLEAIANCEELSEKSSG
jgi:hypothetical protein